MSVDELRQSFKPGSAVCAEDRVDELRARAAVSHAHDETREVPLNRPFTYILKVVPEQAVLGMEKVRQRDIAVQSLGRQLPTRRRVA